MAAACNQSFVYGEERVDRVSLRRPRQVAGTTLFQDHCRIVEMHALVCEFHTTLAVLVDMSLTLPYEEVVDRSENHGFDECTPSLSLLRHILAHDL